MKHFQVQNRPDLSVYSQQKKLFALMDSEKQLRNSDEIIVDDFCNNQRENVSDADESPEKFGKRHDKVSNDDVILVVQNHRFPIRKHLLTGQNDYFRELLHDGSGKDKQTEVVIRNVTAEVFQHLLDYICAGRLNIEHLSIDKQLQLAQQAGRFRCKELQLVLEEYLRSRISDENLCHVYAKCKQYDLTALTGYCLEMADYRAQTILKTPEFLQLNEIAVQQLISRDTFCAPEIDIFDAVQKWTTVHPMCDKDLLLSQIRLPLIDPIDLETRITESDLFAESDILDAFRIQKSPEMLHKLRRHAPRTSKHGIFLKSPFLPKICETSNDS